MVSSALRELTPDQRAAVDRHSGSCPVKLGHVAKDLGVAVRVSRLGMGISGQIARDQESKQYVIRVNRHEARERQRFTIAHELAHYLLHRRIIDASPEGIRDNVLYRSGNPERIECEANRLAAEIVMPGALLNQKLNEFGGRVTDEVIKDLAEEFQVSEAAMEMRLDSLATARAD